MNSFSEKDLRIMGYIPDGGGGFRRMTDKEINLSAMPKGKDVVIKHNENSIDTSCRIFIPGDVMSKKNSKQIIPKIAKKDGKIVYTEKGDPKINKIIISSKQVADYERATKNYWLILKNEFLSQVRDKPKPYRIEFHFVFSGKRERDYINMAQLPLDLMQEYQWLEKDDMDNVLPVFKPYSIDRFNPGTYIKIL